MMRLAHILDGLRCSGCGALDVLWLDPVRGIVECHECGEKASVMIDGLGPADLLDPIGSWDGDR
ncbi:UNVERIFIED_ORG: Zn ribbon nucleic-acid-binding protein [Microbispora rosea subsp. rosea]